MGTLTGISQDAGLLRKDGALPRAKKALFPDAVGVILGALCGSSTVTCYIESVAGIAPGSRTGLSNVPTGSVF